MQADRTPPIEVNRIVSASFTIYRHRWRPHLVVALVAQLPVLLPTLLLVHLLLEATMGVLRTRTVEALLPAAALSLLLLATSFVGAFLFVLMGGAACELVVCWLERRPVVLWSALWRATTRFWRLAGALLAAFTIVLGALTAVGAFLALFYVGFLAIFQVDLGRDPRVFLAMFALVGAAALVGCYVLVEALVRWSVFVQAVMIEGCGPLAALARSAELVRGNWWRTLATMAMLMAVPLVLMVALATTLNLLLLPATGSGLMSAQVANAAAIAVSQVVFSPLPAIGVTILFFQLRDGQVVWGRIYGQEPSAGGAPAPS